MARSLSDATPSEGGPRKKAGKIIEPVDFSSEVFTEFRDAAHTLTDALDAVKEKYKEDLAALSADCHVKTGTPTKITKALWDEERRLSKAAKKARELEKPHIQSLETIVKEMKGTPMGAIAQKMLEDAKAILN